ncbi:MAG: GNAT family N-acetyltransferase [Rhodobacteraceae bacterium]|nr:GNAT family N-acetyltransferase [Paracoccaceae bacterium]
MIEVVLESPHSPAAAALLSQSHALMQEMFPPEENNFLSLDELTAPGIRFFIAREGSETLGTGALAIRKGYGEIKSMFTAPSARGKGVADALLTRIITEAHAQNLPHLRLETGPGLDAAHRLYARHGFTPCGPFGSYQPSPGSIFFE